MKDLSSHIMDISQNSIRAKATRIEIDMTEHRQRDLFVFCIKDNGCGMDARTAAQACNPFFTSRAERQVGLGLPLLQQRAEQSGGRLRIKSAPQKGTKVTAEFAYTHIDRPPLGDIAETVSLLMAANPQIDIIYKHTTREGKYTLSSGDIRRTLEGIPLHDPEILRGIREMLGTNLKEIKAAY